ncbi:MAG: DNA polymerase Y family protein [Bacteroidota bacterium]|nr:DNA polymerase Y family protein [Bacteroidota bacterium]MDP4216523.1 DNA polymerase Y family protein [Bacteroidota bacterium]MDP4257444.1 DNA polymerase Y family protein [Bacteroidota bacterium]
MSKRFVSLWFRHLMTDYFAIRRPALRNSPFVLAVPDHGRMRVTMASQRAQALGVHNGMVVADARVLVPSIEVLDDKPEWAARLLRALALWCARYTPVAAIDEPDSLVLDVTGCTHLWGDEQTYLNEIVTRLTTSGYHVQGAMADTIGAAWAIARYGRHTPIIETGHQKSAILSLPPAALRLQPVILERLLKLGLHQIGQFIDMPSGALRRRFGNEMLLRINQAVGTIDEPILPVEPLEPYHERLPCLDPICTAGGIEIALTRLLDALCMRLRNEGKGLRTAIFKCYRLDGKMEQMAIGTNRPSVNAKHLFKLFAEKIPGIEPDLGIELFILEASGVDALLPGQARIWSGSCTLEDSGLAELLDRVANKVGKDAIRRYLPAEHYWPERSVTVAASLADKPATAWPDDRPRPIHILARPEPIEVTAPIPDYPPMLFRYKGKLHKVKKADGPERIEHEWWLESSRHRDYYSVEDEDGARYWLFRSGHYEGKTSSKWFLHGFFS